MRLGRRPRPSMIRWSSMRLRSRWARLLAFQEWAAIGNKLVDERRRTIAGRRPASLSEASQLQRPVLSDQVVAERMMLFFRNELKAGGLIDAARRNQHVIGP